MVKWFFNSNMGTAIFVATVSFAISAVVWLLNVEERLENLEESHIEYIYEDDNCVVLGYKEERFCVNKEIE